jgi:hypothetical protein
MNAFPWCLGRQFFAILLLVAVAPLGARAAEETIQIGDTVTVTAERSELGVRDKAATVLSKGDKIHVTELRGSWVGGYAVVKGERYNGWVHRDEVKALPVAPIEVPVIEVPDQADDARAVEALKTAGIKLELNGRGNVQSLSASDKESKLTDELAVHLAGLHQLSVLDLSSRPITDAALQHVAGCTILQELYLDGTQITDDGLKHVGRLTNLEVLALHNTKTTSAGLAHLVGLKQLRVLNLTNCAITDDGLKHLGKLLALDTLALPNTKVTGAGLAHLEPLARLRVLNLIGDAIDDAGLNHLMNHLELRMLYLKKTKVTDAGVKKLDEAVPGLAVYR